MLYQEYQRMRQYEDDYWWYHGLRTLTTATIGRYCAKPSPLILDAGCGTGGQLAWLQRHLPSARLVALDLVPVALQSTQARGLGNLACASVMQLPYPDDTFDAVTSMDVLYIQGVDDAAALQEMRRVLRPGGILILNLPAFEFLRGAHDVAIRTRHRYRRSEVRALLTESSFQIELLTYWNTILFPLVAAARWLSRLAPQREAISDFRPLPAWAATILKRLIRTEVGCLRWVALPIGASVFAVARK